MGYHPSFMPGLCCNTGVFPEKPQKSIWAPPTAQDLENARAKAKENFGYDVCQHAQFRKDLGNLELDAGTGSGQLAVGYMGFYDRYVNGIMAGSMAGCKLQ
jgi:hypothetical protein